MTATTASTLAEQLGIGVGDYFYASWGYDQTNITFFKVVGLTAKGVKVQEWTSKRVGSDGYTDKVVPGNGPRTTSDWSSGEYGGEKPAKVKTRMLKPSTFRGETRVYINWTSFASAGLWNGTPKSETNSLYGH